MADNLFNMADEPGVKYKFARSIYLARFYIRRGFMRVACIKYDVA